MQELSLNILDIAQNSIKAGATLVRIEIEIDRAKNGMRIAVIDNGCGMEESRLKYIFTGCCEVQKDTCGEKNRFAGIGLSVCATIIKAHGGTITAENRKTGGSLFRFTLKKEENTDGEQQI